MDKAGLEEHITRLEGKEERQKMELEQQFSRMKDQLKPGNLFKGLFSKGASKLKSMLPLFSKTTFRG